MKILHVINYFQPKLGYQEYYLARESKKHKDIAVVVTSDRYSPFPSYKRTVFSILGKRIISRGFFIENGVFTIRLKPYFEFKSQLVMIHLDKVANDFKPDIVLVHGLYNFHIPLIALLKRKLKYRLVIDDHVKPQEYLPPIKKITLSFFNKILIPLHAKSIDAIFTTNPDLQEFHKSNFPFLRSKIHFIPLGVDPEVFEPDRITRAKMMQKFSIKDNEIVLFYSGKIIPGKGLEDIIKISRFVKEFMREPVIFMVGNGEVSYINKLKKICQTIPVRIIFHSMVYHDDLAKLFNIANYCLWIGKIASASKYEAISSGIPVIISEISGRSFVAEKTCGFVFKQDNHLEVACWIVKNFQNAEKWSQLSIKVRQKAITYYRLSKIYKMIKNLK